VSRGTKLLIAGAVVLVVLLVAGGGYWFLAGRNDDAPPPVALDPTTTVPADSGAATDDDASATAADGTWQVREDGNSYVGYRIREKLAFLPSESDAVGRTTKVTGSLTVVGQDVTAAKVEADLSALTSDESRRDNAIHRTGLESDQFPDAVFELTSPIPLPTKPARGQTMSGEGAGKLTVHGVTRDVGLKLQGRWNGSTIDVAGQLPVKLSDFGIQPPRIGPVVSIADDVIIELKLVFEQT
jgi:polyisoprenoid-binding protein YceI